MQKDFDIPKEVSQVTEALENAGFEAYLVGGCVRDLIRGEKPRDWDVATNANPAQMQDIFAHAFYNNDFGTVGVVNEETEDETLKVVQVTPYRLEAAYSDFRRPDAVTFGGNLEDDLKRRDFTMNAIAYGISKGHKGHIVDLYKGQKDIKDKIIRAVGEPKERFSEDALRILRAVRLSAELDFAIEPETREAIRGHAALLENISRERIRDEFVRIVMSPKPMDGIKTAQTLGVLAYVIPELEEGVGIEQNKTHKYAVFEHLLRVLQHSADKGWPLEIRLAALFHDIGKPKSRRWAKERGDWTFHGHEVIGARMAKRILERLRFPRETADAVVKLVRWHMFFSDPEKITLSAVRRMVRNVGEERIWDLMNLRISDRIGTGRPKEQPFRFRKYKSMVEEALRDPTSVSMLKIDGNRIMEIMEVKPGPKIGHILSALLEEVLEDPEKNAPEYLEKRAGELVVLPEEKLKKLGESGKQKLEDIEKEEVEKIRSKYWVS